MKKKTYITPETDTLDMTMLYLLSGSVNEGQNSKDEEDIITDPSQLGAKGSSVWNDEWDD